MKNVRHALFVLALVSPCALLAQTMPDADVLDQMR